MSDDDDSMGGAGMDIVPRIALRVTGPWTPPLELGEALAGTSADYQLRDHALVHGATGRRFACDATAHDDDIAELFADSGRLSPDETDAIAAHQVKVHLSGPGGSPEAAK